MYSPGNTAANAWGEVDPITDPAKHWGLTGLGGPCDINGQRCTFQEVQDHLNDGDSADAEIFTVQISKGRDYAFSGAVDKLTINDTTYDFEPFGVYATKNG